MECELERVWNTKDFTIYPCSKLIAWKGLLFRYKESYQKTFGCVHKLMAVVHTHVWLMRYRNNNKEGRLLFCLRTLPAVAQPMSESFYVVGVGMSRVRQIQRWYRRVLLQNEQKRYLAVMMSTQKRLGDNSPLMLLDPGTADRV